MESGTRQWVSYLLMLALAGAPAAAAQNAGAPDPVPAASQTVNALEVDDIAYLTRLGLIRGHLHVGMALLHEGHVEHAKRHMKHPRDELYAGLEDAFRQRGFSGFAAELETMASRVESGADSDAVDDAYGSVSARLSAAESHVQDATKQSAAATLAVVSNLLDTAAEEYHVGVSNGKVLEVHEYQDAYGFTRIAAENAQAALDRPGGDGHEDVVNYVLARLKSLAPLWPALVPDETVAADGHAIVNAANEVRAAARRL